MTLELSRRAALAAGLTAALGGLAACAAIPTDGEVNHYADPRNTGAANTPIDAPAGPTPGASPQEIIDGFLHAGVGAADDYSVARLYLTEALAASWRPDNQTLVYTSSLETREVGQGSYSVTVPVTTQVDNLGLATSYTEQTDRTLDFNLEKVQGEWRIASAPDGTVLSRTEFSEVFTAFTLYFYDPTFTLAVPDIRWFAERPTVATSLVRVLLEGPAPYLDGAVRTAVPSGTQLTRNSVTVENGTADIQLSGGVSLETAGALELERLRTQLTQTLAHLASVSAIQLTINNQLVNQQSLENYREPRINPEVPSNIVGIESNRLVTRDNISAEESQVTIFAQANVLPRQPAMSYSRTTFSFTGAEGAELWLATANDARVAYRGSGILQPSFDRQNWVWIPQQDGSVRVLSTAGQASGEPRLVSSWLEGRQLLSFGLARDGTRVALVTLLNGETTSWVSAIRRDDDGAPQELLSPIQIGTGISPTGVAWNTDEEVILWDTLSSETELVSLTGRSTRYDNLPDVEQIVTGNSIEQVVANNSSGNLFIVAGNSWTRIESSLSAVNYSG